MIKLFFSLSFFVAITYADSSFLNFEDEKLQDRIQSVLLDKNRNMPNAIAKERAEEMLLFAKEYVGSRDLIEYAADIEYIIAGFLASEYVKEYLDAQSIEIEDEVIRSYYNANLESFITPEVYSYTIVRFKTKEEAQKYRYSFAGKSTNYIDMIANRDVVQSREYRAELLPPDIRDTLGRLERLELSNVFRFDEYFVVLFFTEHKPQKYKSFEEVENNIRSLLVKNRRSDLLELEIERLNRK